MKSYTSQVQDIIDQAAELEKKVPAFARLHPDVRRGQELQQRAMQLMQDMADILDGEGANHGGS